MTTTKKEPKKPIDPNHSAVTQYNNAMFAHAKEVNLDIKRGIEYTIYSRHESGRLGESASPQVREAISKHPLSGLQVYDHRVVKYAYQSDFFKVLYSDVAELPLEKTEHTKNLFFNHLKCLENLPIYKKLQKQGNYFTSKMESVAKNTGVVRRYQRLDELVDFVNSGYRIGMGREKITNDTPSKLSDDFVSTSINQSFTIRMANSFSQRENTPYVSAEYDISSLKPIKDWKPVNYRPGPDLVFGQPSVIKRTKRVGETWSDMTQSMQYAHNMEIGLKTGTKPKLTRILIPRSLKGTDLGAQATKTIKSLGLDHITMDEYSREVSDQGKDYINARMEWP